MSDLDIYEKLRARFDSFGIGMPKATDFPNSKAVPESEITLLRSLFTPEQAKLALEVPYDHFDTAADVAERLGMNKEDAAKELEIMAKSGLIFHIKEGALVKYRLGPLMIGILEWQSGRNDSDFLTGLNGYSGIIGRIGLTRAIPVMRGLPYVDKNLVVNDYILDYDNVYELLKKKNKIAVTDCLCRLRPHQMGTPCQHPLDTCLQFEEWADYYVEIGISKYITYDEALYILKRSQDLGLCLMSSTSTDVEILCSCCKCHCAILKMIKYLPAAERKILSNYHCSIFIDSCINCNTCTKRCPVGATKNDEQGKMVFNENLCIGCGLCVSTCPTKSRKLMQKSEVFTPPKTIFDSYQVMGGSSTKD